MRQSLVSIASILAVAGIAGSVSACSDPNAPDRTPLADKWFNRAKEAYHTGDIEDASHAADEALRASPKDNDARILGAKIALTKLDYPDALKLTEGLTSSDAHSIRGRALWYSGDIEAAADELDALLQDPSVKDPWAGQISQLARRGQGRHPFSMEGGMIAAVELPPAGTALVVPCELEGEQILALISTSLGEVVVDSSSRHDPAWVNFRFGGQIEVHDVPALPQDLTELSRELHAPIKALIGVNLLRHVHATFDRRGDQFVVRKNDAAAPPEASRVPLYYVRGGGMMMRADVATKADSGSTFMVDSTQPYALSLDEATWRKAGVDPASLKTYGTGAQQVKEGMLPKIRIGAFDLPQIPAIEGGRLDDLKSSLDIDVNGIIGSGILSLFRVTFTDDGLAAWLEADPSLTTSNEAAPGAPPVTLPGAGDPGAAGNGAPQLTQPTLGGRPSASPSAESVSPAPAGTKKPKKQAAGAGAAK
jgi:hypothetical protein